LPHYCLDFKLVCLFIEENLPSSVFSVITPVYCLFLSLTDSIAGFTAFSEKSLFLALTPFSRQNISVKLLNGWPKKKECWRWWWAEIGMLWSTVKPVLSTKGAELPVRGYHIRLSKL